jgi:hypothetical protein
MNGVGRVVAIGLGCGVLIGGTLADGAADFLLLFTGGIAFGSFVGGGVGVVRRRARNRRPAPWKIDQPRQDPAVVGAVFGGAVGLLAAVLDALLLG